MKKKYIIILSLCLVFVLGISAVFLSVSSNAYSAEAVYTASSSYNKQVQQKLKDLGYYTGSIDGVIGPISIAAIKKFQKDNGLVVDGIVGTKTAAKLHLNTGSQSNSDVYLLAKCVYAEARGEPYVGQVAVAAVILNRVKDPNFPNTISGVIYQPWAFTAVNDGQIKLEPNETAYQAARDAMNGWDPTYGCIYYYNPVVATNKWILTRQIVVTIGKHVFAV